jgi:hypothetical protein
MPQRVRCAVVVRALRRACQCSVVRRPRCVSILLLLPPVLRFTQPHSALRRALAAEMASAPRQRRGTPAPRQAPLRAPRSAARVARTPVLHARHARGGRVAWRGSMLRALAPAPVPQGAALHAAPPCRRSGARRACAPPRALFGGLFGGRKPAEPRADADEEAAPRQRPASSVSSPLPPGAATVLDGTVLEGEALELAYDAERDGWTAAAFHAKVDNKARRPTHACMRPHHPGAQGRPPLRAPIPRCTWRGSAAAAARARLLTPPAR